MEKNKQKQKLVKTGIRGVEKGIHRRTNEKGGTDVMIQLYQAPGP
jgi:hypothetical protein